MQLRHKENPKIIAGSDRRIIFLIHINFVDYSGMFGLTPQLPGSGPMAKTIEPPRFTWSGKEAPFSRIPVFAVQELTD